MEDMISDAVLDKAQKLLVMSSRGTEHEAQVAAQKLSELCFKYNLDIARIEASTQRTRKFNQRTFDVGAKTGWIAEWRIKLVHAVARYNFCRALTWRGTSTLAILGRETNIQLTFQLCEYLISAVDRLRKQAMKLMTFDTEYQRRIYSASFCTGAVARLKERLEEQWQKDIAAINQEKALIVVEQDALDEAFQEAFPGSTVKPAKRKLNLAGYVAGREAGDNISLNKQMKEGG